jgi:DNA-binding SARP family transcriptional activator
MSIESPAQATAKPPAPPVLHLFGGPYLSLTGRRREVPEGSKRLLVFVALHRGPIERRLAAGSLWPVNDDLRASGNLRSALWRLRTVGLDVVTADKWSLRLSNGVAVDLHELNDWAARLIRGVPRHDDLTLPPEWPAALDLLPGWYDDWVLMERERLRQRVLHALEALSRLLTGQGRHAEAVDAAMAVVTTEPLRESAQRVLIEAHLAEGNWVEGRRTLEAYRALLYRELGVEPAAELGALVARPAARCGGPQPRR